MNKGDRTNEMDCKFYNESTGVCSATKKVCPLVGLKRKEIADCADRTFNNLVKRLSTGNLRRITNIFKPSAA